MGWFGKKKTRPDSRDVAIRAIILKYVVVYAFSTPPREILDQMMDWVDGERQQFLLDAELHRSEHWSGLRPLREQMSPSEHELSLTTDATMSEAQQINATWRAESLTTILWALSVVPELPPYDVQASAELFGGFAPADVQDFVETAQLRPIEAIDKARDVAELWHWRSRTRQIIENGQAFLSTAETAAAGFDSYDSIVRVTAKMAAARGDISNTIDEDFPAFGKAYRDLSNDKWSQIRSITMERHFALNWLCGYAPDHRWDETPTDT